jgi:hypothetical protein
MSSGKILLAYLPSVSKQDLSGGHTHVQVMPCQVAQIMKALMYTQTIAR